MTSSTSYFILFFLYPLIFLWLSRGRVREPFIRILPVALRLGFTIFSVHASPLRLLRMSKQAGEYISFFSDSLHSALSRGILHRP